MQYLRNSHAARDTNDFVFQQLIPYIGNKRKLLWLIGDALAHWEDRGLRTFVDVFSGSSVVSRYAKKLGLQVVSNDWEPYAEVLATATIACNQEPEFASLGGYARAIDELNALPPRVGWVTEHLCPREDADFDTRVDRLFFMRKNGMRIDAIRERIRQWQESGHVSKREAACLLAPLLYQTCYRSNTSGVFKGFHEGWGGRSGTATHRICGDLVLRPLVFHDNERENRVHAVDAARLASHVSSHLPGGVDDTVYYLDPPYNQHPYGSNYHVLNTVTLWDAPPLSKRISGRNKAAIRTDWRTKRRSAYTYRKLAAEAFEALLDAIPSPHVLISYSTDGMIPLERLVEACARRGSLEVVRTPYKRYRVSPTRPSPRARNVEFVLILDKRSPRPGDAARVLDAIHSSDETGARQS